jgi:hypothetical protein
MRISNLLKKFQKMHLISLTNISKVGKVHISIEFLFLTFLVEDGWLSEGVGWLREGDGWLREVDGWLREGDEWLREGDGWPNKYKGDRWLVARLLATAALWV